MTSPSRAARFSEVFSGMERPYCSETELVGGVGLVAVSGETDVYTAAQLRRDIDEAAALTAGDLVLDLSDVDHDRFDGALRDARCVATTGR